MSNELRQTLDIYIRLTKYQKLGYQLAEAEKVALLDARAALIQHMDRLLQDETPS